MDIFSIYATNDDAEQQGRYQENGDAQFLIARNGNDRYSRMLTNLYEIHKFTLDNKSDEESRKAAKDRSDKIMVEVMSKSILLGWTGNVKFRGEQLPYSVENAVKLLQVKDFRNWVNAKADDFKNYLEVVEADDAKNSAPTSSGALNGEVA
jgi:hypothetical protein